jgi:osmotically-inducible protein OsmY
MNQLSEIVLVPPQFADTDIFNESDLKRRVSACLKTRLPRLEGIEVTVMGNTVILRGALLSAEEKRHCYECCRHVPGVMRVMEEIVVLERPQFEM